MSRDTDRRAAERAIKTGLVTPEEVVEWIGLAEVGRAACLGALRKGLCPSCKAHGAHPSGETAYGGCWCCGACDKQGAHTMNNCPTCSPLYAAGVRRGS